MVTGDNLLTAVSVAREADMIGENDVILLSNTSCDESNQTASLSWNIPEKFGLGNRNDSNLNDERYNLFFDELCYKIESIFIILSLFNNF